MWRRVSGLFVFLVLHGIGLFTATHAPSIVVSLHVLSIFATLVGLAFVLFNFKTPFSTFVCHSFLFATTLSWIIIDSVTSGKIAFMAINGVVISLVLLGDMFEMKWSFSKPELEVALDSHLSGAQTNNSESSNQPNAGISPGDIELGKTHSLSSGPSSSTPPFYVFPCELTASLMLGPAKVDLSRLPLAQDSASIPQDLRWSDFTRVEHRLDSSSCHIYSAFWSRKPQSPSAMGSAVVQSNLVILKIIKAERVTSPLAMSEFATEAAVLSRLRHPHIISLLGTGKDPRPFLVFEVLEGGTLSHSLGVRAGADNAFHARSFSFLETLRLGLALAEALQYLHSQWHTRMQIIHRDIKPDNIGWAADGSIKLFDFGLCSCVVQAEKSTDTYQLTGNTGTLRYMAPEVALGKPYNASVDVYSFGMILWQICTGKVPFVAYGKKAFLEKVVVGGLRPKMDSRWPSEFQMLLSECWHHNKDNRPSFAVIVTRLRSLLAEAERRQLEPAQSSLSLFFNCLGRYFEWAKHFFLIVSIFAVAVGSVSLHNNVFTSSSIAVFIFGVLLIYLVLLTNWFVWLKSGRSVSSQRSQITSFLPLGAGESQLQTGTASFNPLASGSSHGV